MFNKRVIANVQEECDRKLRFAVEKFQQEKSDLIRQNANDIKQLKIDNEIYNREQSANHARALKEKEFEINHFKDERIQKLEKELRGAAQTIAVLTKEKEMLEKITDLNSDVIDIKGLVKNLIDKLPEVKISSLSVHDDSSSSKK